MKFLMLVRAGGPSEDEIVGEVPDVDAWVKEMDERGIRLEGHVLLGMGDARMVRVRGGSLQATDGPFAEAREHVCGFDILECKDLDEAVEVAAGHPMAYGGTIEVRPYDPEDGD